MKTTKITASQKYGTPKPLTRKSAFLGCLTISELGELCDDPGRNVSGQEVQAVLTPHKLGYGLSARDGGVSYDVIDENDQKMTFRTVEMAFEVLSDVPHLLPEVVIDTARWNAVH